MGERPQQGEAGSSTLELVLVLYTALLMIMLVMQFALIFHAREVAETAAQEGLEAIQAADATLSDGRRRAQALLAETGGVRNSQVEATRGVDSAQVIVVGQAPSVVGWVRPAVFGRAQGPVERFVPEPQR